MIAIRAIGLCTAQGSAADLIARRPLAGPAPLPFEPHPRAACRIGFAARGIAPELAGPARWRALADAALAECGWAPGAPLVVGSSNGTAEQLDTAAWRAAFDARALLGVDLPIASAACASGLHALWLASQLLAAGADEVTVLAVEILSPASCANFEALRVLVADPAPWQDTATGFLPGEAAVALRLGRGDGIPILGPFLDHDLEGSVPALAHDALAAIAPQVAPAVAALVVGQGTGPTAIDDRELAAIRGVVADDVPLTTTLAHFGHTVGASSLLSLAIAALAQRGPIDAIAMPHRHARDGRPLASARAHGHSGALIVCRALGGACAAVGIGTRAHHATPPPARWLARAPLPPLRMPILRRIAAEAIAHRPASPPAALLVILEAPLVPPEDARIGSRILPSVVLELTPGFVAQLISRAWGFSGPAVTLVGGTAASRLPIVAGCRAVEHATSVVYVCDDDVEWDR